MVLISLASELVVTIWAQATHFTPINTSPYVGGGGGGGGQPTVQLGWRDCTIQCSIYCGAGVLQSLWVGWWVWECTLYLTLYKGRESEKMDSQEELTCRL